LFGTSSTVPGLLGFVGSAGPPTIEVLSTGSIGAPLGGIGVAEDDSAGIAPGVVDTVGATIGSSVGTSTGGAGAVAGGGVGAAKSSAADSGAIGATSVGGTDDPP